jgi:hypothetical protein
MDGTEHCLSLQARARKQTNTLQELQASALVGTKPYNTNRTLKERNKLADFIPQSNLTLKALKIKAATYPPDRPCLACTPHMQTCTYAHIEACTHACTPQ